MFAALAEFIAGAAEAAGTAEAATPKNIKKNNEDGDIQAVQYTSQNQPSVPDAGRLLANLEGMQRQIQG